MRVSIQHTSRAVMQMQVGVSILCHSSGSITVTRWCHNLPYQWLKRNTKDRILKQAAQKRSGVTTKVVVVVPAAAQKRIRRVNISNLATGWTNKSSMAPEKRSQPPCMTEHALHTVFTAGPNDLRCGELCKSNLSRTPALPYSWWRLAAS